MTTNNDPFAGWTMAEVGCYWSRALPDGTTAHLCTWQNGSGTESGYRLTSHGASMDFGTLDEALQGFSQLENYYGALFTGSDMLLGPRNDPPDLGESVQYR